jgi:hypothetical protein
VLAGQIGLVRHSGHWVGKIVEWATDSTSHHVVVALDDALCVSADIHGVVIRAHREFHSLEWSEFDLTGNQQASIVRTARSMVGRPYNMAAILLLLLSKLTSLPIPRFAVKWLEDRPNLDCSQAADLALLSAGINLFPHESALVVPAHFEHYFLVAGWLSKTPATDRTRT